MAVYSKMFGCGVVVGRLLSLCILLMSASIGAAQMTGKKSGILIMAHGGSPEWNAAVEEAIAPLRKEGPVTIAFGMAERESLQEGAAELESQGVDRIAVVRLFISGESFLHQTEYMLNLRQDPPAEFATHHGGGHQGSHGSSNPAPISSTAQFIISKPGLMDFDSISTILSHRIHSLSKDPANESVLILAHGMGDEQENNRLLARMSALTHPIEESGKFRALQIETLREDWPDKRKVAEERIRGFVAAAKQNNGSVIVVPFRLFGFGDYDEVLDGLDYSANRLGLLPHPLITEWIRLQAEACFRSAGWENPFSAL